VVRGYFRQFLENDSIHWSFSAPLHKRAVSDLFHLGMSTRFCSPDICKHHCCQNHQMKYSASWLTILLLGSWSASSACFTPTWVIDGAFAGPLYSRRARNEEATLAHESDALPALPSRCVQCFSLASLPSTWGCGPLSMKGTKLPPTFILKTLGDPWVWYESRPDILYVREVTLAEESVSNTAMKSTSCWRQHLPRALMIE
jgi:hypothetical protein